MRCRYASLTTALIAGIVLSSCGVPSDLPTAQLPPKNALPTPTLVPTPSPSASALPSPSASALPSPSASALPSPSASVLPSPSASALPSPSASALPSPSSAPSAGHPIAREIAEEFSVPVEEVEGYHAMGIGYGILAQFYGIANNRCGATAPYTVDQLIAMKQSGMGMGEIRKQALGTASAKSCSLGRLKQHELDAADAKLPPGQSKSGEAAPSHKSKKDKPGHSEKKSDLSKPAKPDKSAPKPKPAEKSSGSSGKGKK